MKKIKLILLLSILFLLTGCSGTYNITLNENLTVDEKIDLKIKDNGETYNKARELFINNKIDEDKYKIVQSKGEVIISYNEKYNSIEEYILKSVIYKQLYNEINYTKQDKEIEFYAESKLKLDSKNQKNIINDYNINLLQINFETPLKVYSANSDENYKNKYTWNLTSNTTEKKINILIDPTNEEYNYKYIIVIAIILVISITFFMKIIRRIIRSDKL